jgi:hypothetical protein
MPSFLAFRWVMFNRAPSNVGNLRIISSPSKTTFYYFIVFLFLTETFLPPPLLHFLQHYAIWIEDVFFFFRARQNICPDTPQP